MQRLLPFLWLCRGSQQGRLCELVFQVILSFHNSLRGTYSWPETRKRWPPLSRRALPAGPRICSLSPCPLKTPHCHSAPGTYVKAPWGAEEGREGFRMRAQSRASPGGAPGTASAHGHALDKGPPRAPGSRWDSPLFPGGIKPRHVFTRRYRGRLPAWTGREREPRRGSRSCPHRAATQEAPGCNPRKQHQVALWSPPWLPLGTSEPRSRPREKGKRPCRFLT